MCRGQDASVIAAFSGDSSKVKWQLEQREVSWCLTVEAEARPDVDLSPSEVKLQMSAGGESLVLPMPKVSLPIEVASASCKYSKKRRELVLQWPKQESKEAINECVAEAEATNECAAEKTQAPIAEEAGSESTESPATEEAGSEATSSVEETPSDAAEEAEKEESKEAPKVEEKKEDAKEEEVNEAPKAEGKNEEAAAEAPKEESKPLKAEDPVIQDMSAEDWKALGNEAIKTGNFKSALENYTNGLAVDPDHAMILSNRALCNHKLGKLQEALEDAQRVVELKPDFYKAYIRGAMALRELKRPQEALALLKKAPHNDEVGKLVSEVRPEAEAAEEARIAALNGPEKMKEEGNALFKKGLFEQAVAKYTEIIEKFPDAEADLILAVRNNRAACHHQLSNFHAVVEDSTWVLERDPENLKALVRRMIALEPLERYERAMEDARHVLRHCPGHDVANKVQHRLGKLVREMNKGK